MNYPPTGQGPTGDESSASGPDDWQPYGQDPAYWDPYSLPPAGYQPPPDYPASGYYPPIDYYAPAGYQPPMYPAGYPGGYGYPGLYRAPSNNDKAITSLVCGIISICIGFACCVLGLPCAAAAIALGAVARREIADAAGYERGEGMALAGMITGGIGALSSVAWIGLMLFL